MTRGQRMERIITSLCIAGCGVLRQQRNPTARAALRREIENARAWLRADQAAQQEAARQEAERREAAARETLPSYRMPYRED